MMIEKPDLNLFTDDMLWKLVRKNHREAFMLIYDRHSRNLYIYVLQIASASIRGKQLEEDTKNIIIHVFETLWTNRETLPDDICLEDHLFISAYHYALDYNHLYKPLKP